MRNQAAAARAESGSNCQFPSPRGALGKHQIGDVCAGNQQHQGDSSESHVDGSLQTRTDQYVGERFYHDGAFMLVDGLQRQQGGVDGRHSFTRLAQVHAGAKTPVNGEPVDLAHLLVGGEHQRLPELRFIPIEGALLENANDVIRFAVEQDLPAQDVRIGAEVVLPSCVTDDDYMRGSGLILSGGEGPAQSGARAKYPEVIGCDRLAG